MYQASSDMNIITRAENIGSPKPFNFITPLLAVGVASLALAGLTSTFHPAHGRQNLTQLRSQKKDETDPAAAAHESMLKHVNQLPASYTPALNYFDPCDMYATRKECCSDPAYPVLGGIDLVNYRLTGQIIFGNPKLEAEIEGISRSYKFWFADKTSVSLFQSSPEVYLPMWGGFEATEFCAALSEPDVQTLVAKTVDLSKNFEIDRHISFADVSADKSQSCGKSFNNLYGIPVNGIFNTRCISMSNFPNPTVGLATAMPSGAVPVKMSELYGVSPGIPLGARTKGADADFPLQLTDNTNSHSLDQPELDLNSVDSATDSPAQFYGDIEGPSIINSNVTPQPVPSRAENSYHDQFYRDIEEPSTNVDSSVTPQVPTLPPPGDVYSSQFYGGNVGASKIVDSSFTPQQAQPTPPTSENSNKLMVESSITPEPARLAAEPSLIQPAFFRPPATVDLNVAPQLAPLRAENVHPAQLSPTFDLKVSPQNDQFYRDIEGPSIIVDSSVTPPLAQPSPRLDIYSDQFYRNIEGHSITVDSSVTPQPAELPAESSPTQPAPFRPPVNVAPQLAPLRADSAENVHLAQLSPTFDLKVAPQQALYPQPAPYSAEGQSSTVDLIVDPQLAPAAAVNALAAAAPPTFDMSVVPQKAVPPQPSRVEDGRSYPDAEPPAPFARNADPQLETSKFKAENVLPSQPSPTFDLNVAPKNALYPLHTTSRDSVRQHLATGDLNVAPQFGTSRAEIPPVESSPATLDLNVPKSAPFAQPALSSTEKGSAVELVPSAPDNAEVLKQYSDKPLGEKALFKKGLIDASQLSDGILDQLNNEPLGEKAMLKRGLIDPSQLRDTTLNQLYQNEGIP